MKIFIAKLPYQYQEADITELFAPYGEISSVNLIIDRETGRSKCYAFVEMPNEEEATAAITNLDEKEILDKTIAVSQAKERPERSAGGGGGRNIQVNNPFFNEQSMNFPIGTSVFVPGGQQPGQQQFPGANLGGQYIQSQYMNQQQGAPFQQPGYPYQGPR